MRDAGAEVNPTISIKIYFGAEFNSRNDIRLFTYILVEVAMKRKTVLYSVTLEWMLILLLCTIAGGTTKYCVLYRRKPHDWRSLYSRYYGLKPEKDRGLPLPPLPLPSSLN